MPKRAMPRKMGRRDAKVELMKMLMDLLASKGYVSRDRLGISMDRFKFYCEAVGGVVVGNYCKRKDFEFKVVR